MKKSRRTIPFFIGLATLALVITAIESFFMVPVEDVPVVVISEKTPATSSTPIVVVPEVVKPKIKVSKPVPLNGLVGFWDFDECSGINPEDKSSFDNKGYMNGDIAWATSTKDGAGCALSFNGPRQYVSTSPNESINLTDDLTISAWIKGDNFEGNQGLVEKTDNAEWDYSLALHDGKVSLASSFTLPATTTSIGIVSGPEWHNIVAARAGGLVAFYIDGEPAGTSTMQGKIPANFVSLVFGTHRFKEQFIGSLDDVRIYNRNLSTAEITQLSEDKE